MFIIHNVFIITCSLLFLKTVLLFLDSLCWNNLQRPVSSGQYFTPFGKDTCEKCKCLAGKAVGCFFEKCPQLPNCGQYKQVEGTCCDFECLEGKVYILVFCCINRINVCFKQHRWQSLVLSNFKDNLYYLDNGFSDKTELSVLLSLGTGLALLLIILILVLYCRRQGMKKEQNENEMRKTQTDQSQSTTTTTATTATSPGKLPKFSSFYHNLNVHAKTLMTRYLFLYLNCYFKINVEVSAESSQEGRVKLPPPYSCEPRCLNGDRIKTPPNEPPPPYVDREESAV